MAIKRKRKRNKKKPKAIKGLFLGQAHLYEPSNKELRQP